MWKRGKGPTTKARLSNLLGAEMSEEQDSNLDEEMQTPDTLDKLVFNQEAAGQNSLGAEGRRDHLQAICMNLAAGPNRGDWSRRI